MRATSNSGRRNSPNPPFAAPSRLGANFQGGCVALLAHSVEKSLCHKWTFTGRLTLRGCQGTFFSHCYGLANRGRGMSFQITVLKVLAGHPGGRASLNDLRRAVAILISSGPDWTNRTKRLLARVPGLDIFTQAFVLRDEAGWQITHAGKAFLAALEAPIQVAAPVGKAAEPALLLARMPASPVIQLNKAKGRRVRPGRAHSGDIRSGQDALGLDHYGAGRARSRKR
jgi:hypothetical protein